MVKEMLMRKIGFSTACFYPNVSMNKILNYAKDNDFDFIEIAVDLKNFKLNSLDKMIFNRIKKLNTDNILNISFHSPEEVNLGAVDLEKRNNDIKVLYNTVDLAYKLGIEIIVIHPGHYEDKDIKSDLKIIIDYNIKVITELALYARKLNITLYVENLCHEKGSINKNIKHFYEMCKKIGLNLISLTLDTNHADLIDGLNESIAVIGNDVGHIHFCSNKGVVSDHCIPQDGVIDFYSSKAFFKNFTGVTIIELNASGDMENCKKNINLTREFLFSLIQ
jgi:sugar phosphate isomerase/epimerase